MTRIQYQECIDACMKCMDACNYSYVSSLKEYDLAALRRPSSLTANVLICVLSPSRQ